MVYHFLSIAVVAATPEVTTSPSRRRPSRPVRSDEGRSRRGRLCTERVCPAAALLTVASSAEDARGTPGRASRCMRGAFAAASRRTAAVQSPHRWARDPDPAGGSCRPMLMLTVASARTRRARGARRERRAATPRVSAALGRESAGAGGAAPNSVMLGPDDTRHAAPRRAAS
eukprot:scaffold1318_cov388-Prasinococcus_capsulatus_cf.AAC.80